MTRTAFTARILTGLADRQRQKRRSADRQWQEYQSEIFLRQYRRYDRSRRQ